jgi:DNA-binding transcriptional LysR family regulator
MTAQPQTLLDRGEVDLIIAPDEFLAAGHPSKKLFTEEYVCISWLDNPHTRDGVSFDTYFGLRHAVTRYGQTRATGLDESFLERFAQRRRIGTMTLSLTALPYSVVGTQMLATLHGRMAEQFASHLPLRISPVPVAMPSLTEALQWHQFREQDPGITWLRELICRTAAEFGQHGQSCHQLD